MHPRKLYTSLALLAVFIFVFFLKDRFTMDLYQDENHYLPTAALFATEPIPSLHLLQSYNELNTPIPFILGGWTLNLFGEDIQNLRLLTAFTSFALLMLFVWYSPGRTKRFWLCLGGLLIFPNYYLVSVYYYTDIFAMVFTLAGVIAYLRKWHWAGFLSLAAAVCCRQYMLAFPAAILAFEVFKNVKWSTNPMVLLKSVFADPAWIWYALAVLSIVPWVMIWHGPAPASVMADQHYDSDKLVQYNFGYLMYASVVVAVYYIIPETLVTRRFSHYLSYPRKHPVMFGAFLLILGLIIAFFPAKQAYNPYFTWPYLGYVDELLMKIGISGLLKQLVFGVLALVTLVRFVSPRFTLATWVYVLNVLLLGKAQLSWDKYSLPMIMVLWFLAMYDEHWALAETRTENEPEAVNLKY
ncbi:hypothetical protein GCM10010967_58230 [Dyadobacter beijingensis]|uniref:Dolichyl-phosphate-mannose-protein mannosyltransferase n=1 Tax=Dyadobacter beijingensis TaxID=365489 RepID=A0ABQ2INF0_9BACT|nr:hypothetical protein [Dyadobacter beijingensis]GGN14301.1 hypothetical protein GCM10010967_58230 [Dyadobacter beijingensis]